MTSLVRAYQPGDEAPIVELSNRSLAPYAGWVPRTVDYWRWSVLARPGVHATDILVLESDGRIVGYTVLRQDGSVLDFLVDPELRFRRRRAFVKQLVVALEGHARARRCDLLTFSLPVSDRLVDKALREAGYVVEQYQHFSIGILNPRVLLEELLRARRSRLAPLRMRSFTFELTPGRYPFLLSSRLLVQLEPSVRVDDISDAVEYPRDCVVRIDLCALTDLIFCRVSADTLLKQSQLEITPASSIAAACELLDALMVDADWHVPHSDWF